MYLYIFTFIKSIQIRNETSNGWPFDGVKYIEKVKKVAECEGASEPASQQKTG